MNLNAEFKFLLQRIAELDARITLLEAGLLPPTAGEEAPPPLPPPTPEKPWYKLLWRKPRG